MIRREAGDPFEPITPEDMGEPVGLIVGARGATCQALSGRMYHPLAPDPHEVYVGDIAGALAKVNRFGGHTRRFYSVAQHSVVVSHLVPLKWAPWALMHDAGEAYIGDITRPLKRELDALSGGLLSSIEERWLEAIGQRLGLSWPIPPAGLEAIRLADETALATERRDLMAECPERWAALPEPMPEMIHAMSWRDAERTFLERWAWLVKARNVKPAGGP